MLAKRRALFHGAGPWLEPVQDDTIRYPDTTVTATARTLKGECLEVLKCRRDEDGKCQHTPMDLQAA